MKGKKILSMITAAAAAGTLLAGCGSTAATSDTPASSEVSSAAAETTAASGASSEASESSGADLSSLPATQLDGTVTATPEMYPDVDMSDPYTVKMYLIGDTPNDWDEVQTKINDYLKPFNTSVETTFMSWSDYQTMYSLTLAGGSDVDLIFTAPWCYMYSEAAKGSFYTLDSDFIHKNMPLTEKYQEPESWDEVTISGSIVAVPSNVSEANGKLVAIRKDLADKYGIGDLTSWDDYMNFAQTIAEKETPQSGIYAEAASADNAELWAVYRQQYNIYDVLANGNIYYNFDVSKGLPSADDITFQWTSDTFRNFAKDMKKLADAGAWSRSALNETVTDDDAFGNLQGASIAWNTSVFTYMKQAEQTEGVECAAYYITPGEAVPGEAYSNNDMAIAASSENPERTAMFLDLIKNDTTLNRLICLGEEGVHYSIDENGDYTELDKASDFPAMTVSASWAIKNGNLTEAGADPRKQAIIDYEKDRIVANPCVAFVFDDTSVRSYMDAVDSIVKDYYPSLELGLVDDVDASIDEMEKKCKDAGLDQITEELKSQYTAWAATRQ